MQSYVHDMFELNIVILNVVNLFNSFGLILNLFRKISINGFVMLTKYVRIHSVHSRNGRLSFQKFFHRCWSS